MAKVFDAGSWQTARLLACEHPENGHLNTIVNLHHRRREVSEYVRRPCYAARVQTFEEHDLLGTAGSLRAIANQAALRQNALAIHADNRSDCDLGAFVD